MWLPGGPSTPSISCVTTTPIRGAAVHEARKDTKKLRSVLRLVRESLGDSNYRRENNRFRDAARNLGRRFATLR